MIALLVADAIRQPAEWERQSGLLLSWSTYDPARGQSVHRVQREIVEALRDRTPITLLVRDAAEEKAARSALGAPSHVTYRRSPNAEIWVRDFGPTFVSTPSGPRVATFRFDFWSYDRVGGQLAAPEDAVDEAFSKTPIRSRLISEGGNREPNGRGEFLMTWAVEKRRNPRLSRAAIEREYRRTLGAKKIYWVPDGGAEDDLTMDGPLPGGVYTCVTTGGHIDNVARWAADGRTVLYPEVTPAQARRSPIARLSKRRYDFGAAALRKQGLRLIRVPTPDLSLVTLRPGDGTYDFIAGLKYRRPFPKGGPVKVAPAGSYLNFMVSNGVVLMSKFGTAQDAAAAKIVGRAFPKLRVVAIDTMPLALGGGGIHCITQPIFDR